MEQALKQRLVGAVVITSFAAIFVPMLFDDPIDKTGKMISELKIPDVPIKVESTLAVSLPHSIDDVLNRSETKSFKQVVENKKTLSTDFKKWFIQVGTFAEKSNATELQAKLRKAGFSSSISKITLSKGPLHRVRVGPIINKKSAESQKIKLKESYGINGILSTVDE